MTAEDLSSRELALLKLIDIQAKEITQLGMQVESLRYNKRFTNTKHLKKSLAEAIPYFNTGNIATIDPKKLKAAMKK